MLFYFSPLLQRSFASNPYITNMKRLLLLSALLLFSSASAQISDVVTPDPINNPLHQANIGRITFMNGNIPIEQYQSSDFLKNFDLTYRSDLNIRVFMDNSITNYLHRLAPEWPAETLIGLGNYQFSFYVDGNLIYTENVHPGAGVNKDKATVFRVPLTSTKGEDWWAMYLWDRFKANGGEKALAEGSHLLKIEIRPYLKKDGKILIGSLIAQGELTLVLSPVVVSAAEIAVQPIKENSGWPLSKSGYDVKPIEALNTKIAEHAFKEISSIVVISEGKLLIEEYFNGADRNTLHDTRSVGKSFASTLMGMAIQDGYIANEEAKLGTLYNLQQYAHSAPKKADVKIKDLLTMSSAFEGSDMDGGSPGNEENMYPAENWVKFALDLPMDDNKTNGAQWDYFTAGVVLLGDIINKAVPDGLEKYAEKKLFQPLGISNFQWQYTPQKVPNTAGSLQLSALDLAKYGQLYQNKGKWNGKQILSKEWAAKTLTRQIEIPQRDNEFYGYLFWNKTYIANGKAYETFYCSGNGGNRIIVFKDVPLTIVITAKAYNKPYAHSQTDTIVSQYLLPAVLH